MTKAFEQLFEKFLQDNLSPDELKIFLSSVKQQANAEAIRELLTKKLSTLRQAQGDKSGQDMEAKFQQMLQKAEWIRSSNEDKNKVIELFSKTKFFSIRRIAAAASIILMLGVGSYFLFFNKTGKKNDIVKTEQSHDVKAPQTNRAMITLANGERVYLDSAGNGTLATQGNVNVVKTADGQIVYNGSSKEVIYNTLTNPRGSKVIDMQFADGSHVWLNAGSSVTYPITFIGNERKVEITGEAYFEVTHNTAIPFVVSRGETAIQVLGTHFNVNAFDDEVNMKVTLLEGSVKVTKGIFSGLLKPGQQAQVSSEVKVINAVDIDEVMAWKNGIFSFNYADIQTVMKQLSRWYDVEVTYEGSIPRLQFGGKMGRDLSLSQVLRLLEKNEVHLRIEGRKIIVTP